MARCASMISAALTPVRSSCTASASANSRGLPRATRAPPPLPILISAMPSACKRAQRVARHDPADAVARRDLVLGADAVAGLELFCKQRVAHVAR